MTQVAILIPARKGSQRLPGKPLADIAGEPMIVHVWRRAQEAGFGAVIVAVDDPEIAEAIEAAGGQAILTPAACPSGSDRIWAALEQLPDLKADIIINLQGDLPTISPQDIQSVLIPLKNTEVDIATLAAPFEDREADLLNPHIVKVDIAFRQETQALGFNGQARAFFRLPKAKQDLTHIYHHVGIYAYRREALAQFIALPPSENEKRERLEQLRAMDAGMRLDVQLIRDIPLGVDTPEDLEKTRAQVLR